jgi:diaminopimelate decarboxylase
MKVQVLCSDMPDVTPDVSVNENGHMVFAGLDTVELAKKYGTPLFVMNEDRIRENCRFIKKISAEAFGDGSLTAYASKAFSCRQIYRIMKDEGMCADVVSGGELYTALSAGFNPSDIFFHGNNKTESEIKYAIESRIGCFVADNLAELDSISRVASGMGIEQNVILRVSPGIDPHTHEKISTGKIDSKFGIPIGNGQADEAVGYALGLRGVNFLGFHYHIGSQITESAPFAMALENALAFLKKMKARYGFEAKLLNIGGGFGIRYTDDAPHTDYKGIFSSLHEILFSYCRDNGLHVPVIITEPGRSIVADSGITLYTVGAVKTIPGYKSYVSVDGGMSDNPRYALYQARYSAIIANKADRKRTLNCTIAGRCCESGDLIATNIDLQAAEPGDILAVFNTGAYNYAMASNYNRVPRPPVVMIKDGRDYVAVRRESYEDLTINDN